MSSLTIVHGLKGQQIALNVDRIEAIIQPVLLDVNGCFIYMIDQDEPYHVQESWSTVMNVLCHSVTEDSPFSENGRWEPVEVPTDEDEEE